VTTQLATRATYLADNVALLKKPWPENRTVNIVCHGHSVPAGYFATPVVNTFQSYPHLLHAGLKARYPFAVINVIVTAIGGENSQSGAARFETEVLCHRPDVLTIDYALNDRGIGLGKARAAWVNMLEKATARGVKVLLLTPTPDQTQRIGAPENSRSHRREEVDAASQSDSSPLTSGTTLRQHAEQIRQLAAQFQLGLVDSLAAFEEYQNKTGDLSDLLSWSNHPNRAGHELVARGLLRWFPMA
jgi:acyl-CoA thioesterase-1